MRWWWWLRGRRWLKEKSWGPRSKCSTLYSIWLVLTGSQWTTSKSIAARRWTTQDFWLSVHDWLDQLGQSWLPRSSKHWKPFRAKPWAGAFGLDIATQTTEKVVWLFHLLEHETSSSSLRFAKTTEWKVKNESLKKSCPDTIPKTPRTRPGARGQRNSDYNH